MEQTLPESRNSRLQSFPSRKRERLWRVLLSLAIALGIGARVWAATQWPANFQSDEAVFGLMARHILAGNFTPTLYGPAFLGSIESIIAAGFMSVLGPTVMAFRMSALLLFAAFFVLHAIFTTRYFGYPIAFVSLLFLALPGFHVLEWTYQPIGAYGAMFVIGTLLLLVAVPDLSGRQPRMIRAAAVGVLAGLGLWANTTMILYLVAIGLVTFLSSDEWRATHARLSQFADRVVMIPLSEWMPVAILAVGSLGVLALFSGACRPEGLYAAIASAARVALIVLVLGVVILAAFHSKRLVQLGLEVGAGCVGFALGYSLLLYRWFTQGIRPYWAVYSSCPTSAASRAKLLLEEILPALWGIPTYDRLQQMAGPRLFLWIIIAVLTITAIGLVIWWNRVSLWRIASFSPIQSSARPLGVIILLLAAPILVSLLAGNTVDLYSIRHALVAVPASAIVFALFLARVSGWRRTAGLLIGVCWIPTVGIANLVYANSNWYVKFTRYDPPAVSTLESYLLGQGIRYGYADYWGAYTLDFVWSERITIAPYNGIDRYPAYSSEVESSSVQAFIFPHGNAPAPTARMDDLLAFLGRENLTSGEGPASDTVRKRLEIQKVASVREIASWDIWIVADR
jgi:hypothetical protein